jgi:hypothetical protein
VYGGIQHILCCVFALIAIVLCLVYDGIQHILCCVFVLIVVSCVWWYPTHIVFCFCFACLPLVSCVWWYPTHIVLCFCFDCFRLVICVHTVTFLGLSILECPWNMSVENYTSLTSPLFNWNSSWNKQKKCVVMCLCSMGYRFCMFLRFFYWILEIFQPPLQSVPMTSKVVSSNRVHGELCSIQHYVIKFVSDLRQVGDFLRVFRFPPPIKLTATI